jgi:long-subunit acyl-CoA synthetase (AMP-forming)
MIGIFAENRPEWIITELASCSDSVTLVPIPFINQFIDEDFMTHIINITGLSTICVSKITIKLILDLKLKKVIDNVKNLVIFDDDFNVSEEQCVSAGLKLIRY